MIDFNEFARESNRDGVYGFFTVPDGTLLDIESDPSISILNSLRLSRIRPQCFHIRASSFPPVYHSSVPCFFLRWPGFLVSSDRYSSHLERTSLLGISWRKLFPHHLFSLGTIIFVASTILSSWLFAEAPLPSDDTSLHINHRRTYPFPYPHLILLS